MSDLWEAVDRAIRADDLDAIDDLFEGATREARRDLYEPLSAITRRDVPDRAAYLGHEEALYAALRWTSHTTWPWQRIRQKLEDDPALALFDRLDAALRADDATAVGHVLEPVAERDRKAMWPHVENLSIAAHERRSPYAGRDAAFAAAYCWTVPSLRDFTLRTYFVWGGDRHHDVAIDALLRRRPTWLAKWRLPSERSDDMWPTYRALELEGIVERGDPARYVAGLLGAVKPADLLAHPELVELVYDVFAHPELELWGRWTTFAAEHLDRERVLDLAHVALGRDTTWPKRRWLAELIDGFEPTPEERRRQAPAYLRLLTDATSPAIGYGQSQVQALLADGRVNVEDLLPVADGPFLAKEKQVALDQLALLEPSLGGDHGDEVARAIGAALGHVRPDVQRRALQVLRPYVAALGAGARADLAAMAVACAPSLRAEVEAALGAPPLEAARATTWTRPPAAPAPTVLDDDGLTEGLLQLMGRAGDPLLYDRVLDGLLRRADRDPSDNLERHGAAVARARRATRSNNTSVSGVARLTLDLAGADEVGDVWASPGAWLKRRGQECQLRLRTRVAGELLSLPTDGVGRLDPAVLAERTAHLPAAHAGLADVDGLVACLRSGTLRFDLFDRPWREPAGYDAYSHYRLYPHDGGQFPGVEWLPAGAWATLWPRHVEAGAEIGFGMLTVQLDHEPDADSPDLLGATATWLAALGEPLPDAGAALLTLALGAKVTVARLAAVDAVLTLVEADHLDIGQVAECAAAQVEVKVTKLSRLATSFEDVAAVRPDVARDLAIALAGAHAGHRDVGGLLGIAVEAAARAGAVPLPQPLLDLAARSGSSRAVTEARRLRDFA